MSIICHACDWHADGTRLLQKISENNKKKYSNKMKSSYHVSTLLIIILVIAKGQGLAGLEIIWNQISWN